MTALYTEQHETICTSKTATFPVKLQGFDENWDVQNTKALWNRKIEELQKNHDKTHKHLV